MACRFEIIFASLDSPLVSVVITHAIWQKYDIRISYQGYLNVKPSYGMYGLKLWDKVFG